MALKIVTDEQPSMTRVAALTLARDLAEQQSDVLGRSQLAALRVPRWVVRLEIRSGRWARRGRQTLTTHNGPLSPAAQRWVAVLEVGRRAALDGVSALQAAGVTGLSDTEVTVITPKGSTPCRPPDVVVQESRMFREADVMTVGIRRIRPAVAAVHAALWAHTDRQAAYFLVLVIQQRLARPSDLADTLSRIRRHRRRPALRALVAELVAGSQSLHELDVAADLRRRGFPVRQQVVRRRPSGTEYLDIELDGYEVCVEVDGIGHQDPARQLSDLIRDILTLADGKVTVRLPMLAYVLDKERVLDAVGQLLGARGWTAAA